MRCVTSCKEKLLRVWVCPKESKSFLCSLGFCFGIEVVKNSEWDCVFCTVHIWGAKPPPLEVKYKMQCSQKIGQKKWSYNYSQKTSRLSTPTPPLQKGFLTDAALASGAVNLL